MHRLVLMCHCGSDSILKEGHGVADNGDRRFDLGDVSMLILLLPGRSVALLRNGHFRREFQQIGSLSLGCVTRKPSRWPG